MPATSTKQANTAKLAGALKSGHLSASKAGPAVKSMAKMPMSKLKHFMHKEGKKKGSDLRFHCDKCKTDDPYDCTCHQDKPSKMDLIARKLYQKLLKNKSKMSEEQKKKLLIGLRKMKEGYAGGGNTDITNADNLTVNENDIETERHVIAKTFDTKADFDSYVNQHRGIEMTSKEQQAIAGFKNAKPTQQDRFFVKYEKTDNFGINSTTVIKKLKDGQQFCWTAFTKHEKAAEEAEPEGGEGGENAEVTVNDEIRIIKTITFMDDIEGSNILGDFLRELEL